MSEAIRSVELGQAFAWTCEDCDHDNFEYAVPAEKGSIDPELFDDAEDTEGDWVMMPVMVKCRGCGGRFRAAEPSPFRDDADYNEGRR